jgi:hypothetical protein
VHVLLRREGYVVNHKRLFRPGAIVDYGQDAEASAVGQLTLVLDLGQS